MRKTILPTTSEPRRRFLKTAAGTGLAALGGLAGAQSFDFQPNQRYPDPRVFILDPSSPSTASTAARSSSWVRACAGPRGRCTSRSTATCF
jgi:gluconolactonase